MNRQSVKNIFRNTLWKCQKDLQKACVSTMKVFLKNECVCGIIPLYVSGMS
tara:strand:+ start:19678 stop:19830 length:153 start_codon:yes stop_codon:yes gene_type:complete